MKENKYNSPPFDLDESKLKKALVFGSAITLTATPSFDVMAEDNEAEEEIIVTASKNFDNIGYIKNVINALNIKVPYFIGYSKNNVKVVKLTELIIKIAIK